MKILVRYQTTDDNKKAVIDAKVVPDNELQRYARRAAELNKDKNNRLRHVIEEVPDDSLLAFMARDRHYDVEMCKVLATSLYKKVDELRSDVDLFLRYCSEAIQATQSEAAHDDSNGT